MLKCRICQKEIGNKQIGSHLIIHNIKYDEYVNMFYKEFLNDFPLTSPCKICSKLVHYGKQTCCRKHGYEYRTLNNPHGLHFGIKRTIKSRMKQSKIMKRLYKNGTIKPSWLGRHHTKETKQLQSEKALNGKRAGKNNGMFGKTHTPETIKKIFSYRKMNKLEELVAMKLNEAGIKYKFQYFIVENGICKSYDFKITGKPIIIETDGDFWHGKKSSIGKWKNYKKVQKNDKLKDKMANIRGLKVLHFWESDILKNPNLVVEMLNKL